jgi:hypothetical protein
MPELPLESMSTADKLKIMETVWSSLRDAPDLPVPDWHRDILAERRQQLEAGQLTVSSWEDAKKRLNELGNAD